MAITEAQKECYLPLVAMSIVDVIVATAAMLVNKNDSECGNDDDIFRCIDFLIKSANSGDWGWLI